jgi:hypothetical protein
LVREYQDAQQAYSRALADARSDESRRTLQARRPDAQDFTRRMLDLARENPGDRVSFDALSWVLSHGSHGAQADQAYDLLAAGQVADVRLSSILQHLSTSKSLSAERLLRTALEKSPESEIQAHACYSLALMLSSREHPQTSVKRRSGKPTKAVEKTFGADQETKFHEEVVLLYGRLATEFHHVKFSRRKTFGEIARAALEKLNSISRRAVSTASDTRALP